MKLGYVYAVDFGQGLVKIGRALKPEARIRALETQSGRAALNYWFSPLIEDYEKIELQAHKELKEFRRTGEWFSINLFKAISTIENTGFVIATDESNKKIKDISDNHMKIITDTFGWNNTENTLVLIEESTNKHDKFDHSSCGEYPCESCLEFSAAVDCVFDGINKEDAVNLITASMKCTKEKAMDLVNIMDELGIIQFSAIIGKSQVIALLEQDKQVKLEDK